MQQNEDVFSISIIINFFMNLPILPHILGTISTISKIENTSLFCRMMYETENPSHFILSINGFNQQDSDNNTLEVLDWCFYTPLPPFQKFHHVFILYTYR